MSFRDAFPILHTPDLEHAAAFYTERLGFEERYRVPTEGPAAFVLLGLATFELGFAQSSEVAPAGRVAFWLYTDGVDERVAALREAGVEVVREPEDMDWGERMAIVLDPDGNQVCIGQRL